MKNVSRITPVILIVLLVYGCMDEFYFSSVPITNSRKSTIDTSLIGYWGFNSDSIDDEEVDEDFQWYLKILPINDKELLISYYGFLYGSFDTDFPEEWYSFVGHNSQIDTCNYFNLRFLDWEYQKVEEPYCFFTYQIIGDTLITSYLSEEHIFKKFESSREFKKYIKNNQGKFNESFKNENFYIKYY